MMIIAVDFDGTICEHKYPEIGKPYIKRIEKLKKLKSLGHKLILWTCRNIDGHREVLKEAIDWCKGYGLEFDAINDDLPEIKITYFGALKGQKVYADVYFDDRNVTLSFLDTEEMWSKD